MASICFDLPKLCGPANCEAMACLRALFALESGTLFLRIPELHLCDRIQNKKQKTTPRPRQFNSVSSLFDLLRADTLVHTKAHFTFAAPGGQTCTTSPGVLATWMLQILFGFPAMCGETCICAMFTRNPYMHKKKTWMPVLPRKNKTIQPRQRQFLLLR